MVIGFTGHRDGQARDDFLPTLLAAYPGAVWVHGGAIGFDSQVAEFAAAHGIEQKILRPEYDRWGSKLAPIKRNQAIVDQVDFLVACYDGRTSGGTYQTIQYAVAHKVRVMRIQPIAHLHKSTQLPLF